jgi:hypothetical protein
LQRGARRLGVLLNAYLEGTSNRCGINDQASKYSENSYGCGRSLVWLTSRRQAMWALTGK